MIIIYIVIYLTVGVILLFIPPFSDNFDNRLKIINRKSILMQFEDALYELNLQEKKLTL